ncbi:PSP1 domain-containing protein [Geotoga petraea]|jgi:cell fate regulator YaaT (PSP1 superfamily)|uniref:PSP1 C-terminal domain-containing protein n=1 Tax=Geotoga petraea TaxID=28234 RepID=A0A4Z0W5M3_9BACT|nr:regulatory iron-sulfur-containing complex subunit RicT [Geotoga petraea]MDK2945683.1 hypothetical protein [Geotoga sp.]TGG88337.1 hypothetical protein E4650_04660 [Geotoga petraea]
MPELKINVYGVELMKKDKMYFFQPNGPEDEYNINDLVLVNSDLGLEVGKIIAPLKERNFDDLDNEPTPIIRKLTEEDKEIHENILKDANEVKKFTQEKSEELNLQMRVLKAKYTFDKSKLIIFFGADSRVDFRELVKILAKKYKVRIELRQVGIRDEVKMKGSLGLCGQVACCARFLREFSSIKMELAKTQQMMINTAKISGRCGKLLCCLKYENEFYEEVLRNVPNENSTIEYDNKPAKVITVNVFLKEVTLQIIEENQPILIKVPFQYFNNLDEKIVKE